MTVSLLKFMDRQPTPHRPAPPKVETRSVAQRVLDALGDEPATNSEIAMRARAKYASASSELHRLKRQGIAKRVATGWVKA